MKRTPAKSELVKQAWKMVKDIDPAIIGDAFYSKLFSETPSLRKMFPAEMTDQYTKLLHM